MRNRRPVSEAEEVAEEVADGGEPSEGFTLSGPAKPAVNDAADVPAMTGNRALRDKRIERKRRELIESLGVKFLCHAEAPHSVLVAPAAEPWGAIGDAKQQPEVDRFLARCVHHRHFPVPKSEQSIN